MTEATFYLSEGMICSFEIKGHSGYAASGEDIVCAAISSTVWMTVNTLENILHLDVEYKTSDADVFLEVSDRDIGSAQVLLEGFRQFLCNLSAEYKKYLTVKEVQKCLN